MSSLKSAQTPQAAPDTRDLVGAIVNVAERSFFAFAEPAPAGDAGEAVTMPGDCYELSVAFSGGFAGIVRLLMPIALARDLCAAFSGLSPDEPLADDAVCDLAGEFANMACGTWLTGLEETVCFSLAHPFVTRVPADTPVAGAVVLINDQPVGVQIELVP
jgi:hypothetical protein